MVIAIVFAFLGVTLLIVVPRLANENRRKRKRIPKHVHKHSHDCPHHGEQGNPPDNRSEGE